MLWQSVTVLMHQSERSALFSVLLLATKIACIVAGTAIPDKIGGIVTVAAIATEVSKTLLWPRDCAVMCPPLPPRVLRKRVARIMWCVITGAGQGPCGTDPVKTAAAEGKLYMYRVKAICPACIGRHHW